MADPFSDLLKQPSRQTYLALRSAILADAEFDLFSDALTQFDAVVASGRPDAALAMVPQLMPTFLLSASAHVSIARAARLAGDTSRADAELSVAGACLFGLMQTGDGTSDEPYRVIHIADEADVLGFLDREQISQRQELSGDRVCDILTDATGQDHWFDITDSLRVMSARIAPAGIPAA